MIKKLPWFIIGTGIIVLFAGRSLYSVIHNIFVSNFKVINEELASISITNLDTWMTAFLSGAVTLSALYIILANNVYSEGHQKWAFGVIGTILGYWFKP